MNKSYASITLLFMFFVTFLNAQKCFEKGVNVIEPGIGLGIYKTEMLDKSFPNLPVNYDTTGAKLFQVGYEYGVTNWLGAGGKFNYSSYLTGDSSSESGRGLDLAAFIRAHALRTKHIDLFAGLDFGYTHLAYDANNYSGGTARAGGTYFSFNLNSRFYFGKMWGMRLFYNFDSYNYPNGEISDSFSNSFKFSYKEKSFFLMGIGFMFKLA